ncbi:FIMAH domain-containing protein [Lederbergia panacisoli]|uniref:FIMAH domain-containing protein n=1 Tax=Lederbergia panacisoli TaxID=1255251 RepID=UPI00214C6D14|nr:chondroitinase-B domain-containing protein [Lederbergia panacisoli]MCR2821185.1 hypothetical protein [Lederbergia panacisoli]
MLKRRHIYTYRFTCIVLAALLIFVTYPPSFSAVNGSSATELVNIETYGNFETAGIDIKFENLITDETASVFYKKSSETIYREGHHFTKYDGNHMAASLFDLKKDTTYDIKIVVNSSQGSSEYFTTVKTKPEYTPPLASKTVNVGNQQELDAAIANAKPGDHILLDPTGVYSSAIFENKSGTEANPILIGSQGMDKPFIEGPVKLYRSNYIVVNNLEVHNEEGIGVQIRGSHYDVVVNSHIHDSIGGPTTYHGNIHIHHSDEGNMPGIGGHLIMNNVLSDEDHEPITETQGPGNSNTANDRQTYFGIKQDDNPGAFTTMRGNIIYGVVDGIAPSGDENSDPVLDQDDPDLLLTYPNQNMDIYDNIIYNVKDDGIEMDGLAVNSRVFRNHIGKAENSISVAPVYPGPIFFVGNSAFGADQGSTKLNTGVRGETRNLYFYNNTFVQKPGTTYGVIYRGEPAKTNNIVYKNNIFLAETRVVNSDNYNYGMNMWHLNHVFDYNLGFSKLTEGTVYKWSTIQGDPLNNARFDTLEEFRTATGQEEHGVWGDPILNLTPLAGYPEYSLLLDLSIASEDSPAIGAGAIIPGITNRFAGDAPDIGAFQYGLEDEVEIEASIEYMNQLIDQYIASGELGSPLTKQLENSLKQAEHHLTKGSIKQATKFMQDFLKHMNNKKDKISANARLELEENANKLIDSWN